MRSETRVIGGFKFMMEQVGGETGEQIVLRLARPIAAMFQAAKGKGLVTMTDGRPALNKAVLIDVLVEGIGPALERLQGRDLRYLRKKLCEKTTLWMADGDTQPKPWPLSENGNYDRHFAGRYKDMIEFLKWGIELNAFFDFALRPRTEAAGEGERESRSDSPPASPGGSTGSSSRPTAARA